ncbi:phosphopantetheine-binding protein [Paracidovorax avenae ATCC 19860]|uniref:Acyl carrier protein n=1 Tax=Paracidovorax avenae (strain ATCC 19860 / DSM 7227 / CCUG 15838 / JCM 20985 / LMG 2117 / NCPPB 1011) TaxID=643561 RepID=F0Q240_PARA1|nr:acyl carrier protein [Paracidovorax avenae]ADX45312.1 phosphopantetheine-binding protein [Paracidovorax avenae ATCC 19860]AVS68429.1 acyl carrier protein [Paracidovorax avenae]
MNTQHILDKVRDILVETFEIDANRVTADANLFEDLDLDSIDAVDLAIKLQEMTGRRIQVDRFKSVRTVSDLVTTVQHLLATAETPATA